MTLKIVILSGSFIIILSGSFFQGGSATESNWNTGSKGNRIYIREEFRESLGMNFVSPFQPEREFKVYKSCKCLQIICSRVH